jgi:hypothetical protein
MANSWAFVRTEGIGRPILEAIWAIMLFWALLASGPINMRKVDGWQTLAVKPSNQPIDLAS